MRRDEGGCADLRRSLTAHHKLVRSPTYAPARRPRPRAGVRGARGCARGVSAALASAGRHPIGRIPPESTTATLPGAPQPCGTAPSRTAPARRAAAAEPPDRGRNRPVDPAGTRCHRPGTGSGHPPKTSRGGYPSTARPGQRCREVKSRHSGRVRANRAPLPLDAAASPELPGIRGSASALHGGHGIGHNGKHSSIGALSYDTYARAAAPVPRGARASCGPACTRA